MVPGSMVSALRRLVDSGAGEADGEADGVETSEPESSAGGVEDGEGRDFRCRFAGGGLASRV